MKATLISALVLILLGGPATGIVQANTITVPSYRKTVSLAMPLAASGDTILVSDASQGTPTAPTPTPSR